MFIYITVIMITVDFETIVYSIMTKVQTNAWALSY
jgi:hypothetical protein